MFGARLNERDMVRTLDTLMRFLLYVLIFWLPYSPAVIETCVSIMSFLWIVKRILILNGQPKPSGSILKKIQFFFLAFKPVPSALNIYILFFIVACIFSTAGSVFPMASLKGFVAKTMEWFVIYFLTIEIIKEKRHLYILLGILIFTSFSTGLDSLYQFYLSSKDIFFGHRIEPHSRATAGFKTPNDLAGYLTIFIPFIFAALFLKTRVKALRIFFSLVLVVALWSVIVTFTRGAWIGIFLGFSIFIFNFIGLKKQDLFRKYSFYFLLITLAMVVIPLLLWLNGYDILSPERLGSVVWRQSIWKHTYQMIGESPIFGHGPNTFMRLFQEYFPVTKAGPTYAHNCFLQITAETGLLGLAAFLAILFQIFKIAVKGLFENASEEEVDLKLISLGILSGIVAFLVHSFFDTNFYSLQLSVYFWISVGILFCANNLFHHAEFRGIKKSPIEGR